MIQEHSRPVLGWRFRQVLRRLLRAARGALLVAGWGAIAGCAVGPDFERPSAPSVSRFTAEPSPVETESAAVPGGAKQQFVAGLDLPGEWWALFHSESLNALVARSVANNPDLRAAQAALRGARETYYAQQGVFYPSVQAAYTPSRQRDPVGTISPTLTSGAPIFNLYNAQISVGYVVDVFGGNRRALESAAAQAEAQRFQLDATYLTLTSNVVASAIQEAGLRAQIAATEEIIRIETEQLGLLHRQYELGEVAYADVVAQDAALAQAQSSLFPLKKQLAQQRTLLTALAGRLSSDEIAEQFDLSQLDLPRDIPLTLPSQLVEQRPDIRMAEAQLHSSSAQVGIALANMLPQINLSGTAGGTATAADRLFQSGNTFWSVAAGLSQPLFEGGALLHRKRAAEAALDQAGEQYRSVVITAFQNVTDALHALEIDAGALAAAARAERAAAESLALARRQLELGAIGGIVLLNAEQTYQQASINLALARMNRYSDTVALFQALGGGWWNRPELSASAP